MGRSVEELSEKAGAMVEAQKKGLVATQNNRSGRHAGHVLQVEKGNRAVKGLQRPIAGCTGRRRTGERSDTYLW
jgi:hypothetical protein